jgi:hypothetical protein
LLRKLDNAPGCAGRIKTRADRFDPAADRRQQVQGIGYSNDNPGAYADLLSKELMQEVPAHVSTEAVALKEPLEVGSPAASAIPTAN